MNIHNEHTRYKGSDIDIQAAFDALAIVTGIRVTHKGQNHYEIHGHGSQVHRFELIGNLIKSRCVSERWCDFYDLLNAIMGACKGRNLSHARQKEIYNNYKFLLKYSKSQLTTEF